MNFSNVKYCLTTAVLAAELYFALVLLLWLIPGNNLVSNTGIHEILPVCPCFTIIVLGHSFVINQTHKEVSGNQAFFNTVTSRKCISLLTGYKNLGEWEQKSQAIQFFTTTVN